MTAAPVSEGGGVWIGFNANPVFANNLITGNIAGNNGGGVCCRDVGNSGSFEWVNNTIVGNQAVNTLEFSIPDALSPVAVQPGSPDQRVIGMALRRAVLMASLQSQ